MMKQKQLVPKRRFKKFTNEWKEWKLGEVAEFNPNHMLPNVFKYVDLESVKGTEIVHYRTEYKRSAPSRAQRLAVRGDVFYQTVRPYQKNNYLYDLPYSNFVFSTGYAQMRPSIDGYFLLSQIQEEKFVKKVLDRCTGTSYPAINSNDLADIEIRVPSNKLEQQKIGQFFKHLDEMIALEQRKIDKNRSLKSAYLTEMFPAEGERVPKRRFEGFTDEWKEQQLGEIVQITMGQSPDSSNYTDNPTDYILVQGNADMKNNRVFPRVWTTQVTKKADKSDLILSVRAPVGEVGITDYEVVLGRGVAGIKGNDFIFQLLTKMLKDNYWSNLSTGSTFDSINSHDINEALVLIPEHEEQQKIGSFFKKIDNTITNHQQKLAKLKAMKQAYLHEIFV